MGFRVEEFRLRKICSVKFRKTVKFRRRKIRFFEKRSAKVGAFQFGFVEFRLDQIRFHEARIFELATLEQTPNPLGLAEVGPHQYRAKKACIPNPAVRQICTVKRCSRQVCILQIEHRPAGPSLCGYIESGLNIQSD